MIILIYSSSFNVNAVSIHDSDIKDYVEIVLSYLEEGIDLELQYSSILFLYAIRAKIKEMKLDIKKFKILIDGIEYKLLPNGRFVIYHKDDMFEDYLNALVAPESW